MTMAQMCEKVKFDLQMYYTFPFRAYERKHEHIIGLPSKAFTYELIGEQNIFEPIRGEVCTKEAPFRELNRIVAIERRFLDKPLEESSLKLCSKLRFSMGLSEQFEADGTALANLDGFMADLAGEGVDASELVKAARRRL